MSEANCLSMAIWSTSPSSHSCHKRSRTYFLAARPGLSLLHHCIQKISGPSCNMNQFTHEFPSSRVLLPLPNFPPMSNNEPLGPPPCLLSTPIDVESGSGPEVNASIKRPSMIT